MNATQQVLPSESVGEALDEYLGFEIRALSRELLYAVPKSWRGDVSIVAESLPAMRKRIWFWWHRV